MTKIDLITGILGSGKTTFLRRYAKYLLAQGQRIAILENDFGAVNVDMLMLQDLKCENCRLEMVSGGGDADCHKRRFKTQLIALGMQHFDRVLIEPSGIFDMDEFFDTLYESPLDQWFSIGSILTIVDATMPEVLSGEMEYLLGSEAACCGKLLLSKLKAGEPAEEASARVLAHLNRALAGIQCRRQFRLSDLLAKQWDDLTPKDFAAIQNAGYRQFQLCQAVPYGNAAKRGALFHARADPAGTDRSSGAAGDAGHGMRNDFPHQGLAPRRG